MSTTIDVAIIGAGAYGLSLAAYLRGRGIEFRIFGKTMDSWKRNMPPGMLLKSHPWSSNLYDPKSQFTIERFCADHDIAYHDSLMALPLETFVAYGEDFQKRVVPEVEQKLLVGLGRVQQGFSATFDDGEVVTARRVVLAIGVYPFKYVPPALGGLPAELFSHTGDYGPLDRLRGKEVMVIGSGASATDLAALLHERGVSVSLCARAGELNFSTDPRTNRSILRQLVRPLRPLIYPGSGIGSTWLHKICADAPQLIHMLPQSWRLHLARNTLGPLGHSAMRDRIFGKLPLYLGRSLESAAVLRDKVLLNFITHDRRKESHQVDHVVAGTGYQVDLGRLGFLNPDLFSSLRMVENTPILSSSYESSIPGLYFGGPATANSFGPVARFVFGAIHPARRVSAHLADTLPRRLPAVLTRQRVATTAP